MLLRLTTLVVLALSAGLAADTIAVLPLFNKDQEKSRNLDWIGEALSETLRESLGSNKLLVITREDREEVYRRMSVRTEAVLTRATVIKVGETLDAAQVVFGDFHVDGAEYGATNTKSTLRISLRVIDLSRYKQSASIEQSGPLDTLNQMGHHLAYLVLKQLEPSIALTEEAFLADRPAIRTEAAESYIRGLLANTSEQKSKLFSQAARLDEHFSQPNFQMGRMLFLRKDYKTAAAWLAKVTKGDSHYLEAQYELGICKYYGNDFDGAAADFRLVAAEIPLNEVLNNLGAALSRKNDPTAIEWFNKAFDGDQSDPDYWFNVGYSLWKASKFREAAEKFRAVLDRTPDDGEATTMLGRCIKMDTPRPGDVRTDGRERIKTAFEDSAFRQLEAQIKKR